MRVSSFCAVKKVARSRAAGYLDIAEGVAFYDRQSYGAGDYFYQRIFDDIESLSVTVGIYETHFGYHRKIATRYPFLTYYRLITTGVEVVAVLDGRSRPSDIEAVFRRRYLHKSRSDEMR